MKKLIKKKVNMFGKTVPVFVIALLGIALVSAALLPYFGKITGLVTVTGQGLLVDGREYSQGVITESWNGGTFTSLESPVYVREHHLENQATVQAEGIIVSECAVTNTGTGTISKCNDIDYRAVEYFDDAGYDFRDNFSDITCAVTVTNGNLIQSAIDGLGSGVVCVEAYGGSYSGFTVNKDDVTVISNGAKIIGSGNGIVINANNVVIEGFEITELTNYGIHNTAGSNIVIKNNYIHNNKHGMYAQGDSCSNLLIEYNTIENNGVGIGGTEDMTGKIRYNVIKNNNIEGIGVGGGQNFFTEGNIFEGNTASFSIYYSGGNSVDATNNYFADGLNINMNGNSGVTVNADWMTKTDFSVAPNGGVDKFATLASFPKMLYPDTSFKITTTVDTAD